MEASHRRVLQLQAQARKDKDILKLQCVNEHLVDIKAAMGVADAASTALTEALVAGDGAEQTHQLSQLQISQEKVDGKRDEAETCLGEEIVFVGPNAVTITGLDVDDDPTDDQDLAADNPLNTGLNAGVEPVAYVSPFAPL